MARSSAPGLSKNPTFTLLSHTQETADGVRDQVPIETSLTKINSEGRLIGKRGRPKPNRLRKSDMGTMSKLQTGNALEVMNDYWKDEQRPSDLKTINEMEMIRASEVYIC